MDYLILKQKAQFVLGFILFMYFGYLIGYHSILETICINHQAKPYLDIPFRHDHLYTPSENQGYVCLKEIPIKMCFSGQPQINPLIKCYQNQNDLNLI
jgi:hypothetical protein